MFPFYATGLLCLLRLRLGNLPPWLKFVVTVAPVPSAAGASQIATGIGELGRVMRHFSAVTVQVSAVDTLQFTSRRHCWVLLGY